MKLSLLLIFTILAWGNLAPLKTFARTDLTIAQSNSELSPDESPTEASPLVQAAKQFISLERYQLESVMEITGEIPGSAFTSNAQINTTVAAPNKFNSQIIFVSPNGLRGKTYQIVSDGTQVWIHNLATNRYSVSNIEEFLQTREGFLIGTLSYFYVSTRKNIGSSRILGNFLAKLPEAQLLKYFQRFTKLDLENLTIRDEEIAGTTYRAYDINGTTGDLKATAYVDARQGNLARLDLSGSKNGLKLASQETAVNLTTPESIAEETFIFSPPETAEQSSQQLDILPF